MESVNRGEPPNVLGRWALAALVLSVAIVLYTDLSRYLDPVGEKYVLMMPPGAADFYFPFNGSKAILSGINPYQHDVKALFDPWHRDEVINGVVFRQVYPPSHLLLFIPLVWISGGDPRVAGRLWFHCNIVFLVALSVLVCALVAPLLSHVSTRRVHSTLVVPVALILAFNQGVCLALERGQSDIFGALLCWIAVVLVLRGAFGIAMFLAVWATLLKAYPLVLTAGLGAYGLFAPSGDAPIWKRPWFSTLLGSAVATLVMLGPVARYLPLALTATRYRSQMFWNDWLNHGFRNLVYNVSPPWADQGRVLLTGFALVVTAACWFRAFRSMRSADASPADRTLWLCAFATCALATMIGYSALSCVYNLIMVLPGLLVLVMGQEDLARAARLPSAAVGLALLFVVGSVFLFRTASPKVSTTAWGVVGFLAIAGAAAIRGIRQGSPTISSVGSGKISLPPERR